MGVQHCKGDSVNQILLIVTLNVKIGVPHDILWWASRRERLWCVLEIKKTLFCSASSLAEFLLCFILHFLKMVLPDEEDFN